MKSATTSYSSKRLLSVDALRGFDMLMISGAGSFFVLLEGKTQLSWVNALAAQFAHPSWNGFTFYDFIFPLFLFISGVSLSFSLSSGLSKGKSKHELYRKVAIRMFILIALGILYKNAPVPWFEPGNIRFVSVLGRIGFAGMIATLIYVNFDTRGKILWIMGILLGYYAALYLIPVPGYGAGDLSFEGNLVGWFDRTFLPGRLLQKTYDELGLLTQFPALCLTVIGTLAGDVLRSDRKDTSKLQLLIVSGIVCMSIGLIWGLHFPINKHLWTSSFIFLTGGMALLMLSLFYGIIEIAGYRKWAFFFQVIGLNSLVIYLGYRFINFRHTSRLLFEGFYIHSPEPWHEVWQTLGALCLVWIFLYILYRLNIFVKV